MVAWGLALLSGVGSWKVLEGHFVELRIKQRHGETESLDMSFKQLGCASLNQSVEFKLKVTTFFSLFKSVWGGLWVTCGHKSFDLYNK